MEMRVFLEERVYMYFLGRQRLKSVCENAFDNNYYYKYDVAVSYDSGCKGLVEN